jgi:hypothetical protein
VSEAFDRFRERVLADPALQARLRGLPRAQFVASVVAVAGETGHDLAPDDVEAALTEARREWLERWI